MERGAGLVLRWSGRGIILLGVFVLVASLFLPDAAQPLNGVVCPEGTELDNARYAPPNAPNNNKLELVCTSATYTESAAKPVLLVVISLVTVGLICIYFGERLLRPRFHRPAVPTAR